MNVTLPFNFDGSEFKFGKVSFTAPTYAKVEGADFEVPSRFALFLLANVSTAWNLLEDVAKAPLKRSVKTRLLETAAFEGMEKSFSLLQSYMREAPNGSLRFYRDDAGSEYCDVHLTDGQKCMEFYVAYDLMPLARKLPQNVYCECEPTHFTLNLKRFQEASANITEFFTFVVRLNTASPYTAKRTLDKCFDLYFKNKGEAYKVLEKIEKDAGHRMEREQLYERLMREKAMKCKGGFAVYSWFGVCYVTEDGHVFKLDYKKDVDMREALLRLVEKGVVPKKLSEVKDGGELSDVAKAVGEVCPQLVPVILP